MPAETLSPNQVDNPQTEEEKLPQKIAERQLGAKILSGVRFQDRQSEIVDSSLEKLTSRGERLSGKNGERRNLAYLTRLERAVEKHGNDLEKKLWERSIDKLIIQPEAIEEGYWTNQEQILRDNGQGRKLSDYEKDQACFP